MVLETHVLDADQSADTLFGLVKPLCLTLFVVACTYLAMLIGHDAMLGWVTTRLPTEALCSGLPLPCH